MRLIYRFCLSQITKHHNMRTFFVLFLSLVSLTLSAIQTKYILFDPNCMDRLEYRYDGSATDYITYQIHSNSSILALEVGIESIKDYTRLPEGTIGCGNTLLDESFVKSINNNLIDVYMVMRMPNGHYRISPARMASYMNKESKSGRIIRPDYEFTYGGEGLYSNGNLATSNSESHVFYSGEDVSTCQPYHFTSISKNTCRPNTDIYYLHGIGIVEERVGSTLEESNENIYRLNRINGVTLNEFKAAFCEGRRIQLGTVAPKPVAKKTAPVVQTAPKPVEFVPKKCKGVAKKNHYLVQYGDNLFSIARREGVSVRQLRRWNNLKSTKVYACSQLRVTAPQYSLATKKAPKRKFKAKGVAKKKASAKKKYVAKKKAPVKKKYVSKVKPKKSTTGVHIVEKGENLYMLATLYGYTLERFAHMNGLDKNVTLQPGMELFTTDCSCPSDADVVAKHKTVTKMANAEKTTAKEMPVLSGNSSTIPAERVVVAPKVTYHVVGEGETIWSIANTYGFDTSKLMERNNLEAGEVLIPGQKIYFPK